MSLYGRLSRSRPGRWSFWRVNWLSHRLVIAALIRVRPHVHGVVLDVGCGERQFQPWLRDQARRMIGIDIAATRLPGVQPPDVLARAEQIPFRDDSFDTVLGLSMLYHLSEPGRLLDEAHRVLRPGGILLLEFEQMVPFHDQPHDYFRFTRNGATWLLQRAGFEVIELIPIGGLMTRVGLSVNALLRRINQGPTRVITEIPVRLLYMVLQPLFALLDRLLFDPREVVAHLAVARRGEAKRA